MDAGENENDLDWMRQQRDRLRDEVDAVTAELRIAQAQIGEQAARIELANRDRSAQEQIANAKTVDALKLKDDLDAAKATMANLHESVKSLTDRLAQETAQRQQLADLAASRKAALGDVLGLVSDVTKKVLPLLS